MENIRDFEKLNSLNEYLNNITKSQPSHAYLLINEDEQTAQASAVILALNLVCNSNNVSACFACANCLKIINKTSIDVFTYPKKNNILVDDVKEIIENSSTKPFDLNKKIFILNNIVNATIGAQNKLLKTLEEPPENVIFILTATSEKAVLPTIASRCKTILVSKAKKEEVIEVLKQNTDDAKKLMVANECSMGSLGKALSIIKTPVYFEIYDFVLNMLNNMKTSKDLISYSSVINKNRKFINIYLEIMSKLFRDILTIKAGTNELVFNKYSINLLTEVSQDYSQTALTKIINKINEHKKMLKYNANPAGVIDTLLVGILEVKYKWK